MTTETNWVVITGPPASGKTTLLEMFAADGFTVSPDTTRRLIADEVAAGRDADEFRFADDFQQKALDAMWAAERRLDPQERVFLEYALPCNIAFHRTEHLPVPDDLARAARDFRYRVVLILEPVEWQADEERVEDPEYQAAVHGHLLDVYRELGYDPIRVPLMPPRERYGLARMLLSLP